jgi:hypothetical protein
MKLSPRQQQLYDLLFGRGDVPIKELYEGMGGPEHNGAYTEQEWLGPYITLLNRRLDGMKVEPGALKQTYRLVRT